MLTPVWTLPKSRPEELNVPNYISWNCGFMVESFCSREKRIGLNPSFQNYVKMTVNEENTLVLRTWLSVIKCWNHCCPAIHPGIVFEKAIAWLLCFKRYLVGLLGKDLDSIPQGPLTVTEAVAAECHYQSCPARHTWHLGRQKSVREPEEVRPTEESNMQLEPFRLWRNIRGRGSPPQCFCFVPKEAPHYS